MLKKPGLGVSAAEVAPAWWNSIGLRRGTAEAARWSKSDRARVVSEVVQSALIGFILVA